jgi:hypothetical protein
MEVAFKRWGDEELSNWKKQEMALAKALLLEIVTGVLHLIESTAKYPEYSAAHCFLPIAI